MGTAGSRPRRSRRVSRGVVQPIWAEDVAACVLAAIERPASEAAGHAVHELAGPEAISHRELADRVLGGRRHLVPLPLWALRPPVRGYATLMGPAAVVTWDEIAFHSAGLTTARGTRDAKALGVSPESLASVLGR